MKMNKQTVFKIEGYYMESIGTGCYNYIEIYLNPELMNIHVEYPSKSVTNTLRILLEKFDADIKQDFSDIIKITAPMKYQQQILRALFGDKGVPMT